MVFNFLGNALRGAIGGVMGGIGGGGGGMGGGGSAGAQPDFSQTIARMNADTLRNEQLQNAIQANNTRNTAKNMETDSVLNSNKAAENAVSGINAQAKNATDRFQQLLSRA